MTAITSSSPAFFSLLTAALVFGCASAEPVIEGEKEECAACARRRAIGAGGSRSVIVRFHEKPPSIAAELRYREALSAFATLRYQKAMKELVVCLEADSNHPRARWLYRLCEERLAEVARRDEESDGAAAGAMVSSGSGE